MTIDNEGTMSLSELIVEVMQSCGLDYEQGMHDGENFIIVQAGWDEIEKFTKYINDNEIFEDENGEYREVSFEEIIDEALSIKDWGFSDEYSMCYGCNNVIHMIPSYYGDIPDYHDFECERLCGDCVRSNPEEYLADIINNPRKSNRLLKDLTEFGFIRLEGDYETGFHRGQNDDPKDVFARLELEGKYDEIVFQLDSVGQFDVQWSVWVRNNKEDDE